MDDLKLIRADAVAELLGVRPDTVRIYALEGRIPAAVRLPGLGPRWRLSEIRAYIEGQQRPAEDAQRAEGEK